MQERLKALNTLLGSKILCFKNGECQGVAFVNLHDGAYYPTLSLYKSVTVSVNFGPNFKNPPSIDEYKYKPVRNDKIIYFKINHG